MVGSIKVSRGSLGAVLLIGFLCFLFFGIVSHQTSSLATFTVRSTGSSKLMKSIGKQRRDASSNHNSHLTFVSKRRVPNGPDPIHNRRAGKSTRLPDRA